MHCEGTIQNITSDHGFEYVSREIEKCHIASHIQGGQIQDHPVKL